MWEIFPTMPPRTIFRICYENEHRRVVRSAEHGTTGASQFQQVIDTAHGKQKHARQSKDGQKGDARTVSATLPKQELRQHEKRARSYQVGNGAKRLAKSGN